MAATRAAASPLAAHAAAAAGNGFCPLAQGSAARHSLVLSRLRAGALRPDSGVSGNGCFGSGSEGLGLAAPRGAGAGGGGGGGGGGDVSGGEVTALQAFGWGAFGQLGLQCLEPQGLPALVEPFGAFGFLTSPEAMLGAGVVGRRRPVVASVGATHSLVLDETVREKPPLSLPRLQPTVRLRSAPLNL